MACYNQSLNPHLQNKSARQKGRPYFFSVFKHHNKGELSKCESFVETAFDMNTKKSHNLPLHVWNGEPESFLSVEAGLKMQ